MRKTPISRIRSGGRRMDFPGKIRAKEKIIAKLQQASIGRLPKEPDADHQSKDLPKAQHQKARDDPRRSRS